MKKIVDGVPYEMSKEEMAEMQAQQEQIEQEYYKKLTYDDAVNAEIRKRYSASQEFAILRQKEDKPDEYAAYFAYCQQCKTLIKTKNL